jgi:UDP:flavonoid glycosyltransferase YjiC (YdhE family)
MLPREINKQKILYAALDWGYGHVTRSIGIIRELHENGNYITIACNSEQELLFKSYFPDVSCVRLEGYELNFGGKGNWSWDLWKQRRSILKTIKLEYDFVENYCQKNDIDIIISDHRYGFYSRQIPSIFVTHQLHLPISKLFSLYKLGMKNNLENLALFGY